MPALFHLQTLGPLELTRGGEPVGARRRKELALLAYLARRSPRPVERDSAMALFWGDRPDAKARLSLRQALFELRSVVGDALVASGTDLRVDPALLSVDATEFEADYAAGRFRAAADRWAGPFLAGLEDLGDEGWVEWLEGERAGLTHAMVAALDHLAAAAEAAGDWGAVIANAERQLELSPDDSEARRRLLLGYRRSGQESKAASAEARFGIRPGPATPGQGIGRSGVRGLVSPDLIGRDGAVAALRRGWEEVQAGAGRIIVVDGAAGIGKSRLLGDFVRDRTASGARAVIATTRAFASQRDRPWTTIGPLLAMVAANAKGVSAVPPQALALLAAIVPELAERFPKLPPRDGSGDPVAAAGRLVAEAGLEQPLLLVVDDGPEADDQSRAVLGALIRHPLAGVLLIVAGRSDAWAGSPLAADLTPGPNLEWLALAPLSEREVGELIGSTAPFAPSDLGRLAARVHRDTGGVPGLVETMLSQLAEAGVIGPDPNGAWAVRGDLDQLPTGGDFQGAVLKSVATLPPDAREVLDLAAVLGPRIDRSVLERVSGLGPEAYLTALGVLVTGRHLREPALGPGRLEFPSEAVRQAVSQGLTPSVRARLERRVAGGRRVRRWLGLGVVAVGLAAVAWWQLGSRPAPQAPGTGVLLADLVNATGEPLFDGSLGVVARVGLQQSSRVWVVPRNQIAEALTRMGRTDSAIVLRGELAREVALRENVPLIVEMDVARGGSGYLVTARLVEAQSGRDLASYSKRARTQDQVLDAVTDVVAQVRGGLGDQAPSDSGFRLARVTTVSLAALQQFSLGGAAWDRRAYDVAEKHYRRAVELDSTFGLAQARLAGFYLFTNNRPAALEWAERAQRFSDRMTEPERLILANTRAAVKGDHDAAVDAAAMLATRYPTPANLSGYASQLFRSQRCREAIGIFRRAIALRPTSSSWINLASCYMLIDSVNAGLQAYQEADRLDTTALYSNNINQEWGLALVRAGRSAAAESAFRKMAAKSSVSSQARAFRSLGFLAMHQGRHRDALSFLDQSLARYRSGGGGGLSVFRNLLLKAQAAEAVGAPGAAGRYLMEARSVSRGVPLEPIYYPRIAALHAQIGDRSGARRWLEALGPTLLQGNPGDSVVFRITRAVVANAEGRYRAALQDLEVGPDANPSVALQHWTERGAAYAGLGLADSALASWQRARNYWGLGSESQDGWDRLPLQMAEAALTLGDSAQARTLVGSLLRQWVGADSAAVDVRRARRLWEALGEPR